jgi:hypothetical protein
MSKILTVNLKQYTLSQLQIDNLASEYYGKVLPLTNESHEMDIEFDSADWTPQTLAANFLAALNNFKEPQKE